jgi:hypothetical protein
MHKHVSVLFTLLIACQAEPSDSDELKLSVVEFEPEDLIFDEDPVTVTGVRIGTKADSIKTKKPPGLQADGTLNLALVPEWIPVGVRGEVVGYARKADVHYVPSTPEEALHGSEIPIYDEEAEIIGEFENGLPRLDADFAIEQRSSSHDLDFPLTLQKFAAAWPLPQTIIWYLQNYVPAVGYPGECARHASGSYGSVFFSNSTGWVSWGGNCNSTNVRPPGWLRSQSWSYDVTGWLMANSGLVANAGWTHVQQTTIPQQAYQYFWCGRSDYWMSVASAWTSTTFCSS